MNARTPPPDLADLSDGVKLFVGCAVEPHMSQGQHFAQVQQWAELEQAGREEIEWRRMEDINLALQEVSAARDEEDAEYRAELESKYPQIAALWPGRNK